MVKPNPDQSELRRQVCGAGVVLQAWTKPSPRYLATVAQRISKSHTKNNQKLLERHRLYFKAVKDFQGESFTQHVMKSDPRLTVLLS